MSLEYFSKQYLRRFDERLKFQPILSTHFETKDERIACGFCLGRRMHGRAARNPSYASTIRALGNNCYNAADNNNNDDGSRF